MVVFPNRSHLPVITTERANQSDPLCTRVNTACPDPLAEQMFYRSIGEPQRHLFTAEAGLRNSRSPVPLPETCRLLPLRGLQASHIGLCWKTPSSIRDHFEAWPLGGIVLRFPIAGFGARGHSSHR